MRGKNGMVKWTADRIRSPCIPTVRTGPARQGRASSSLGQKKGEVFSPPRGSIDLPFIPVGRMFSDVGQQIDLAICLHVLPINCPYGSTGEQNTKGCDSFAAFLPINTPTRDRGHSLETFRGLTRAAIGSP
ncbi:uncharacterized protein PV07_03389 [Cladophialophora immunda]|uniref:Uncharacterized protein n=1 Tax=Cladophialophora immunda TaxID=569365 RepID=A0A0D2B297_9EURO|nr:uncharacterized protein PV07_03389 [Cladophialophora immunda]KIW31797.1 hypothetical protein PV07_03389 [Cladophialophora immunda]